MGEPVYFGFSLPFVNGNTILPLQSDERLIKNDLMALLQTTPGSRVMRPSFGTRINAFVFETMTAESLSRLRSEIINAIQIFEPRVRLLSVDVTESDVPNVLNIKIKAVTTINPNKLFELELGLNLTGGALQQR